jgi:hypothetical protein
LGLFVKARALCTLTGYNIIKFIGYRLLRGFCILVGAILQFNMFQLGASGPVPLPASLINGSIGAFRLASATVDALLGNHYCHAFPIFGAFAKRCKNTAQIINLQNRLTPAKV